MIGMKPGGAPRESGRPRSYRVKQQKSLPPAVRSSFPVSLPYTGLRASETSRAGLPVARKRAKALMAWILPGDLRLVVFLGRYPVLSARGDWYTHETYG